MSTKRRTFTEAFKMQVLSDYYSNGCNARATARKWGIVYQNILRWLQASCQNQNKDVSLPQEEPKTDMRTEEKQNILALQERISQLEKSLEYERLRVAAYERLIEIVKQEDGIDVLKKDGAKQ